MKSVLSVIIVTYNSAAHLEGTLESVFNQSLENYEVLLVDNASEDDSVPIAKKFRDRGLKLIHSGRNLGFGGGNNLGVAKSEGETVFLLNPDTVLKCDSLERVAGILEKSRCSIIGTRLITADGKQILHCGGEIGSQAHCRLFGRGETDLNRYQRESSVEYVVGAAFGIHRTVWDALGGFDEDYYPAYYEDADMCLRAWKKGFNVMYWPVDILHQENVSVPYESPRFLNMHHRNRILLMYRNFPLWKLLFVTFPREFKWLLSAHSKGVRKICVNWYLKMLPMMFRRRKLSRYV